MQKINYADLMPKYLGYPFYPAWFPIQAKDFKFNGKNILECYCFPRDKEDHFIAAAWIDYFVQAPINHVCPNFGNAMLAAAFLGGRIKKSK